MDVLINKINDFFEKKCISLKIKIEEDFEKLEILLTATSFNNSIEFFPFEHLFQIVNPRDEGTLIIDPNGADRIFKSTPLKGDLKELNKLLIDTDGYDLKLKYSIDKSVSSNNLSLYSLSHFVEFLESKGLSALLTLFQKYIFDNQVKYLELQNELNYLYFQSSLFAVTGNKAIVQSNNTSIKTMKREDIIFQRNKYTNPHNFINYKLLPSDFKNTLSNSPIQDSALYGLLACFETLKCILAFSFLSNTSRINKNDFELSIFEGNYLHIINNLGRVSVSKARSLYDVYIWVYDNNFSVEKLTIARPIISKKFIENDQNWRLEEDTIHSIKSAYAIHLKKNVEEYFATINKVTELVTEISIKNKDIIKQTANSFKNNNITLLSFFASIFIFNSLSNDFHKPIFNIEKYYLSMVFLLISALYLLASYRQYKIERHNSIKHFYIIKSLYKQPLQQEDLDALFNKRHFKQGLISADKISLFYFTVWIIEIYLFLIVVAGLTYFNL